MRFLKLNDAWKKCYHLSTRSSKHVALLITDRNDSFQANAGSDQSVRRDALSAAVFHRNLQQLITHCTPISNNTAPPRPKSPTGGLAWPQHKLDARITPPNTDIQKRNLCVRAYVCASKSVPNESFLASSSPGQCCSRGETGSMCLHECVSYAQGGREA